MIRSRRLWAGIGVGVLGYWLWMQNRPSGPRVFQGGWWTTPKPLRRQGRLLRDSQARWNLRPYRGSSR